MSRKTKLNSEVQKKICDALRAGNTRRASAVYAGITHATFYNWINTGENPRIKKDGESYKEDKPFIDFFDAVTRAEAECEVYHVANLKRHADTDWRASVEWLKRRKPQEWSERHHLETNGTQRIIVEYASDVTDDNVS